jgi:hypothetical protein
MYVRVCVYISVCVRVRARAMGGRHSTRERYEKIIQSVSQTSDGAIPFRNFRVVKLKLSLCLTNQQLRHEDVWESGCIDPCYIDLGTSWR